MKAVILAAGKGQRLGEISRKIPKPMIEINGKPILEHNLAMCRNSGITDIYINLHHLPNTIINYFGDGSNYGMNISYNLESELLGTSGALLPFKKYLNKEPFYVIYGDNYFELNLTAIRQFHEKKQSDFTIALSKLDDVSNSGIVEISYNDKISRFIEKPGKVDNDDKWINAGIYFMCPNILDKINKNCSDFGKHIIPLLINSDYNVYGYKMKNNVIPIDTPELLKKQSR